MEGSFNGASHQYFGLSCISVRLQMEPSTYYAASIMNWCLLVYPLQVFSAAAAIGAAGFWFFASVKKAPPPTEFTQHRMEALSGNVLMPLRKQSQVLAAQSRLNAWAALLAGLASLSQLALTFLPSCWWGGW
jgi:hypothetical protein